MELLFPLLLLLPLLLLIMRQRKQQRAVADQQGRVRPGMTVMTTGGLYGTVFDIEDDVVVLEVDEGVYLRFSRLAIGRIVEDGADQGPGAGTADASEADASDTDASDTDASDVVPARGSATGSPAADPPQHDRGTHPSGASPAPEQVDIRKGAPRPASSPDGV